MEEGVRYAARTGKVRSVQCQELRSQLRPASISGLWMPWNRSPKEFRDDCMRRYAEGGSPAAIFREAGLDPKIIGYKRVERCIARWKAENAEKAAETAVENSENQGE